MLRFSSRLIRPASTRNVITWSLWARGYSSNYVNDPQFPPSQYHPSFSIGFMVQTSPEDAINVIRQRYAEPGKHVECWERMRAFPAFPISYQKFCEDVLAKTAIQHSEFSVEIGRPFFSSAKQLDLPALIGFRIAPSPILQKLYASLSAEFDHIAIRMLNGRTHHNPSKVPFLARGDESRGLRPKYHPSVRICRVPKRQLMSRFEEIKEQYPDGAGEVKVVGFVLGRDARKEHYQNPEDGKVPFTFFPFRDFEKRHGASSKDSQVDQRSADVR